MKSISAVLRKQFMLHRPSPLFHSLRSKSVSWKEQQKTEEILDYDNIGHRPVMPDEVIEALNPQNDQIFLDMTFGAGGHSRHLLNAAAVKLYCLDRDPVAYEKAVELQKETRHQVHPMLGRFSEMKSLLEKQNVNPNSFDGMIIDAGCSSMQMDTAERGFSISRNGVLDMRMDGNRYSNQPTAADVLNNLDVPNLAKIFKVYGEEKHSKKIAQALFDAKYMLRTINTTSELSDLIQNILGCEERFDKLQRTAHVATKVFQALRIFVNDEMNELNYGIEMANTYLKPGGKLAVLTFHSLEDRIVKRQFLGMDLDEATSLTLSQKYKNCQTWHATEIIDQVFMKKWHLLNKHVIVPSIEEVESNPRSRSAKLRIAEKVDLPL